MSANNRRTRWFWWLLAAGAALRVLLIWFPRTFDPDTTTYFQLGRNLFQHGVYGLWHGGVLVPSLVRLPAYPIFLALFGGHFRLMLLTQAAIDLLGCWLLYLFARRNISERAGTAVLALSALCIFTAAYAATGLTECLSVFAVSLAIYSFGELRRSAEHGELRKFSALLKRVLPLAGAAALAILLRPDGVVLLAAVLIALLWYGRAEGRETIATACLFAALALLPLAPWTARNWRTFHAIQPLAPEYANNPGERVDRGFIRWFRTWAVEFSNTGNVYWNLDSDVIDIGDLPSRAFDSPGQYARTENLLNEYNARDKMTPALDAGFGRLASARVAAHPLRYYIWLPLARVADMWLRPRTEAFDLNVFWWRWREHPRQSAGAIGLGLLNLAYLAAALAGFIRRRAPFMVLLGSYVALRCAVLALIAAPEARYTLEAYPVVILCAGAFLASLETGSSRRTRFALFEGWHSRPLPPVTERRCG
ncbi:MAG: glycosyltransferase family 39 protein [Acidobacteriaceae bacterium]